MRWVVLAVLVALTSIPAMLAAPIDESGPKEYDPATIVSAPRPEYPYEARRKYLAGSGIVRLEIDRATGRVTRVWMEVSTGQRLLDEEALGTFGKWQFKPGTVSQVRIPITFTLAGRVRTTYEYKRKSMDDVLARFLGKGTVLRGPIPEYPHTEEWTFKQGKGVYELHVDKEGRVASVGILKSSGDAIFDRIAEKTLRKWKLRRGPMVLELPLSFRLTPDQYSVEVAR